jgi:hypothetical protein
MRQAAGVIGVEVRQHNPAHIVGGEAEAPQLRADLLLRRHRFAQRDPVVRVPAREVARFGHARRLAGVDHDQAFGMFDQPREDRQRLGPPPRGQYAEQAALSTAVLLQLLDGDGAGLDRMYADTVRR